MEEKVQRGSSEIGAKTEKAGRSQSWATLCVRQGGETLSSSNGVSEGTHNGELCILKEDSCVSVAGRLNRSKTKTSYFTSWGCGTLEVISAPQVSPLIL